MEGEEEELDEEMEMGERDAPYGTGGSSSHRGSGGRQVSLENVSGQRLDYGSWHIPECRSTSFASLGNLCMPARFSYCVLYSHNSLMCGALP